MEQQTASPLTQSLPPSLSRFSDDLTTGAQYAPEESTIDYIALGDQVPFMLRSREMSAFVATSSPEEQEALEVKMAQQQEALRLRETRKARQIAKSPLTVTTTITQTLLDLPPEILTKILLYLPFTSVVVCQRVSRHLHILISSSNELQYYTHLGMSGLVDNPQCNLSVTERLNQLLTRERRWGELDFDFHKAVDVTFAVKSSTATLSAGVFGGLAAEICRYVRIPSVATEEVKWREIHTEQTIIIDIPCFHEPDLHVLITAQRRTVYANAAKPHTVHDIQVHLNQLSTGEPHPDVRRATISFETHEEFGEPMVFMRCAGDNMVLILQDRSRRNKPDDQVLVYDWRTGELKLSFSAPWDSYYNPLFLTTHLFLLPNATTGELEYWRIPQSPSELTPNHPFFLLSLPRLRSGNTFQFITCLAEPNAGLCDASKPFYTDPEHAIVLFAVNILSAGLEHFLFLVHRSSLVGCLDQFSASISPNKQPKPVPYDEWGPPICRWFDDDRGECLETTFGQRYITPPGVEESHLTVLNFNPIDVAKVLAAEKHLQEIALDRYDQSTAQVADDCHVEGVLSVDKVPLQSDQAGGLGPSPPIETMEAHDLAGEPRPRPRAVTRTMDPLNDSYGYFEHTVYSSLPYTVRLSQEEYRFDELMLEEASILGIQEDEDHIKEIHVLHYG